MAGTVYNMYVFTLKGVNVGKQTNEEIVIMGTNWDAVSDSIYKYFGISVTALDEDSELVATFDYMVVPDTTVIGGFYYYEALRDIKTSLKMSKDVLITSDNYNDSIIVKASNGLHRLSSVIRDGVKRR